MCSQYITPVSMPVSALLQAADWYSRHLAGVVRIIVIWSDPLSSPPPPQRTAGTPAANIQVGSRAKASTSAVL